MKIKELRDICYPQQSQIDDPIFARLFVRKISIYFTRIFIALRVSANAVTVLSMAVSIAGCFFLGFPDLKTALIGILLLHLGYIFDCSDGEIARYSRSSNIAGMYLDMYGHLLIVPLMFFAYSFHLFQSLGYPPFIIIGFLAGLVSMSIANHAKHKIIVTLALKDKGEDFYKNYFWDFKEELENVSLESKKNTKAEKGISALITHFFRHHMYLILFSLFVISAFYIPETYIAYAFVALSLLMIFRELANLLLASSPGNVKNQYLMMIKMVRRELTTLDPGHDGSK